MCGLWETAMTESRGRDEEMTEMMEKGNHPLRGQDPR